MAASESQTTALQCCEQHGHPQPWVRTVSFIRGLIGTTWGNCVSRVTDLLRLFGLVIWQCYNRLPQWRWYLIDLWKRKWHLFNHSLAGAESYFPKGAAYCTGILESIHERCRSDSCRWGWCSAASASAKHFWIKQRCSLQCLKCRD